MYYEGRGVAQDYAKALKWYLQAAEQDDPRAQNNLGVIYANGKGLPQNDVEGFKWFRLAAAQGDAGAQYNLGVMYANGQGVPQDYVRAHMWLNLSGAIGNISGGKTRDEIAAWMTPQQIAEAQKMARECQQRNFKSCD